MTVTAASSPTAGQRHTLDCFATTVDFIKNIPTLEWTWTLLGQNSGGTSTSQINGSTSANRLLTFDPLRTSHGGRYCCRAAIDIPEAGISNRSSSESTSVSVQSELVYGQKQFNFVISNNILLWTKFNSNFTLTVFLLSPFISNK